MGLRDLIAGWLSPGVSTSGDGGTRLPGPGDDFWYEAVAGKSPSGIRVTPEIALKAATVFACARIIAETISSLPLNVFQKTERGRTPAPNHPLDEVISQRPNKTQTAVEFWEMMVLNIVLEGTAYAEIVSGPRGAVDQLLPLRTSRIKPRRAKDGSLRYEARRDPDDRAADPIRTYLPEELFRIVGMSADGIVGLRAVDLASDPIGLSIAADSYASRVFSNALNIGGFITHPKKLSEEAQKNLVHALVRRFAGPQNAHRPIVLTEGMKFEAASMNAREAQLLEARTYQVNEIARVFRVPSHMLGIRDSQPRANVEQDALDFVRYTLRPWVKRIEQAIIRDLILVPTRYVAKFNMDALLRGDSEARAQYFSKALGSGGSPAWLTQNEVRKIEGFNAIDGEEHDRLMPGTQSGAQAIEDRSSAHIALEDKRSGPERLVDKEVAAIRRNREKHASDDTAFFRWCKAFYAGHVSSVAKLLNIPKDVARIYCDHQYKAVAGGCDLEKLLRDWEDGLADEIERTLAARRAEVV